ncbi:hypothetical protein NDU88_000718, partial [Pleurodeles waltl]
KWQNSFGENCFFFYLIDEGKEILLGKSGDCVVYHEPEKMLHCLSVISQPETTNKTRKEESPICMFSSCSTSGRLCSVSLQTLSSFFFFFICYHWTVKPFE